MMKTDKVKNKTLGSISAIQTLLERYPVLTTTDYKTGNTSFSFMFDILKMLGVTSDDIFSWLSNILSEKNGLLTTIEYSIKALIISSFKDMYTCSVNPIIPHELLYNIYEDDILTKSGITISMYDIDNFALLNNCPTSDNGSIYYFDNETEKGYIPSNIYKSMDFNAYLWYVINKGNNSDSGSRQKCTWDNRCNYKKNFDEDKDKQGTFVDEECRKALVDVDDIGVKKEIIYCQFEESYNKGSQLRIFLPKQRYSGRTFVDFIIDYISSLKLFDSKTLSAQIANALLGLSASAKLNFSWERAVIAEKVESIIKKIIETEESEIIEDCYYTFSNEEYENMMNQAMLKYNGHYQSNEINVNSDEIIQNIQNIGNAELQNESTVIKNTISSIALSMVSNNQDESEGKFEIEWGMEIIENFLKYILVELIMQILSPKVMLLYAINEKILGEESSGIINFMKNFSNLIGLMAKRILDLIAKELLNFLIDQLKPIISLFVEKLLLETIMYYRDLINALYKSCSAAAIRLTTNDALQIEDVTGADILVPEQTEPKTNEC